MTIFLGIVAAVVLLTVLVRMDSLRKAKKVEAAFAGRESLAPDQFYERYFRGKGVSIDVVNGVRAILEAQLGADMSRLADTDDFSRNLSFFWDFDSMASVEIACALEERFAITITDEEAEFTKTVGDIVGLVTRKIGTSHVD
ncbi:acyl carrier protein [Actimicrobium sp. GrIS 1.19]|uniref:acyl carrier protein n=1 Tax=Actimicrobium sp. GrIS 1.19 TaxID=3071708 RepID=UPI002E01F54F|nr:acyl carrier protein [Actimicrobium sp. GrIS 1.19]